jgi:hypothetical protein
MPAIPTTPSATWTLEGTVARQGSAHLDLNAPGSGITTGGTGGPDHLLGIDLRTPIDTAAALADHWLRGDDVVGVYKPVDPRRLEATAMWRSISGASATWELVLSAQTAIVESDASLAVTSDVTSGDMLVGRAIDERLAWSPITPSMPSSADASCPAAASSLAAASCLVVRRAADAVLVAVHPADSRRIVVALEAGRVRITCWLFSAAIEKGVLLRGRVLAAIGPAGNDMRWAEALVTAFSASPPPLTP